MTIRQLSTTAVMASSPMPEDVSDTMIMEREDATYTPHGFLMLCVVVVYSALCGMALLLVYSRAQQKRQKYPFGKSDLDRGDFDIVCTIDSSENDDNAEFGDLELTEKFTACTSPTSTMDLPCSSFSKPLPLSPKAGTPVSFDRRTSATSENSLSSSDESLEKGTTSAKGMSIDSNAKSLTAYIPSTQSLLVEQPSWTSQIIGALIECWSSIFVWNEETSKILKLTRSLLVDEAIGPVGEILMAALITRAISDDAVEVYLTTRIIVRLSSFVLDGLTEAQHTYTANAIGDKNFRLAGRYVHVGILAQATIGAFLLPFWYFGTGFALQKVFGFTPEVAQMGAAYVRIYGATRIVETFYESYGTILYSDDHEDFMMWMQGLSGGTTLLLVLLTGIFTELSLISIGLCELACMVAFFAINVWYSSKNNWLNPYWDGLRDMWSRSDILCSKTIITSGMMLSLGTTLETVELQVFSVFAASIGSRQLAAYVILDTFWGLLEAISAGVSDAAQIRVAKNLGKGDGNQAENAAFSSLRVGFFLSLIGCTIVGLGTPFIPAVFTSDPETQTIIRDAMPIILYGTVADTFGCVCSYIVEGQGRFKTVTLTEIAVTFTFTVPLASLMIYVFGAGVPGLLAAISMGYLTSGSVLAGFMLTTDWTTLAKTYVCDESFSSSSAGSDESDDSSSSSSSSSSNSSSSSSESV